MSSNTSNVAGALAGTNTGGSDPPQHANSGTMARLKPAYIVVKREFNIVVYTAMAISLFEKIMAKVMQEHGLALPEVVVSIMDVFWFSAAVLLFSRNSFRSTSFTSYYVFPVLTLISAGHYQTGGQLSFYGYQLIITIGLYIGLCIRTSTVFPSERGPLLPQYRHPRNDRGENQGIEMPSLESVGGLDNGGTQPAVHHVR